MVGLEPRISFQIFTLQRGEVTQGGVEGTKGTLDPPLNIFLAPRTTRRHPIHGGTGVCGAF